MRGFSRYHKYSLGADLRDGATQRPCFNAFEHAIRQVTEIATQNEAWL